MAVSGGSYLRPDQLVQLFPAAQRFPPRLAEDAFLSAKQNQRPAAVVKTLLDVALRGEVLSLRLIVTAWSDHAASDIFFCAAMTRAAFAMPSCSVVSHNPLTHSQYPFHA